MMCVQGTLVTRATRRACCTLTTPCRIRLYAFANAVVPTLAWTRSCNSVAVVLSSSIPGGRQRCNGWTSNDVPIPESRMVSSSVIR